jgi:hypothetical protein
MLRVVQIAERDEGRAAVGGVGRAIFERSSRDAGLTPFEDFVGFDVTSSAVQIRAALDVMACSAGAEHPAQQHIRSKRGASGHLLKDTGGAGAKLARH